MTVGRNDDIRDKVVVSVEDLLWVTVRSVVSAQLPDDDGLVSRGSQEHVWVLRRGSDGGDPSLVGGEGASVDERFRHDLM